MSFRLCRIVKSLLALVVVLVGTGGLSAQTPGSLKEFHQRVAKAKALPDDPLAAVHRLLSLPPVTTAVASFQGNQTAILASQQNAFAMVRETNCSLTAFNAMYSLSTSASSFTYASRTFNFDQQLHSAAGLTTTGGTFAGGCKDPGTGVLSNSLIYVGITPSQMRVGALTGYNSQTGHNQLFTVVSKQDGTLVGITTQPDATGVGANSYPYAAVGGDLNKDGINDLVVVNYALGSNTFSTITIFLGKTDGSFTQGQSYAVPGAIAQTAVLDDFNGDGKLDLVVPSGTSSNSTMNTSEVTFFPGNGDGTFGTVKTTAVTGTAPVFGSLADGSISGDFNGDGKKDLISAYGVVLIGKGDGTFTQASTQAFATLATNSNTPAQLAAGDFNKDGKLDFAAGTGDAIHVYLGNGDGTFAAGGVYASIDNAGYLTATDLDGDGNLDLFSGDATNGIFGGDSFTPNAGYVLMGRGDGSFLGAPQTTASAVTALEDLNGDGKLDYVASVSTGALNVFLGNGDGSFKAGAPVTLLPFMYNGTSYTAAGFDSFVLVDVDGDGHLDIVALPAGYFNANPPRPGFLIALGKSDGTFQAPTFTPFPSLIPNGGQDYLYSVKGLFTARRADGKSEIVYSFLTQDLNNQFLYYEGYATQAVTGNGSLGAVATTDTYTGSQPPNSGQIVTTPLSQFVDLNGDKTPDLIQYVPKTFGSGGVVTSPASFQVYLGKTDGTFGPAATVAAVDNPIGPITVADVNGDGKPDLIGEGSTGTSGTAEIGVALGNGDGTFQTAKTFTLSALPSDTPAMAIADFDGDGNADMAILGFQAPYDSGVFLGNGDGTFQSVASGANDGTVAPTQPIELAVTLPGQSLLTADLNGDGKMDIVGPTALINRYGATTPPSKTNTTTALTASSTSLAAGASLTLTATVTGSGATGTVTFLDGTTTLGSSGLNASGVATLSVSTLTSGSHTITATYGGDASFNASTSGAVTVTVAAAKLSSATTIAASSYSITVGQSVTLSAQVIGNGGATPTGTVTFLNHGTTTLGTGTLNMAGVATLVVSNFTAGNQGVSASYAGDSIYNRSSSGTTVIAVAEATNVNTTTALSASPTSITAGAAVSLTATVTAASGTAIPTGTVNFLSGATSIGTGTLNSSGVATLSVSTLPVGTPSITASYVGATGFNPSVSSAVTVTVTAAPQADYALTLSPATATVSSGASAASTVTITPSGGFSAAVALTCSGLPTDSTCVFAPSSVTPSGAAATSNLTIRTGVSVVAQLEQFGGVSLAGIGLFGLIGLRLRRRALAMRLLCLMLSLAGTAVMLSGCGSSHSTAGGVKTPAGSYTVSVTGTSGTTTHSATFTLTVQ